MRPWPFLRKAGFDFEEQVIYFGDPGYQEQIAAHSPSRRVPLLVLENIKIWDSLAICDYAIERTGFGLPVSRNARAVARSVTAEMHSGFQTLREQCPMNVRARGRQVAGGADLRRDIERLDEIWSSCRREFGGGGAWLFGEFSIADAMFAPVVFRFQTYRADLSPESSAYQAHVLADPFMQQWQSDALVEGHALPEVDRIGLLQSPASQI